MSWSPADPYRRPTPANRQTRVPQQGRVTLVHDDGTVTVRLLNARGGAQHAPLVHGLSVDVGDTVVVEHFDGDPQAPFISAKF